MRNKPEKSDNSAGQFFIAVVLTGFVAASLLAFFDRMAEDFGVPLVLSLGVVVVFLLYRAKNRKG